MDKDNFLPDAPRPVEVRQVDITALEAVAHLAVASRVHLPVAVDLVALVEVVQADE
jgi:hypothetical protein